MNTLKPLLIVAVLAGVGYGVYIRLNSGNNAPPPPVADGWDSTPSVQLPDQPSSAPWGPSAAAAGGPTGPIGPSATAAVPPGGVDNAPPYRPPSAAEFSGAPPPASTAPPSGQSPPESQAPPYANDAAPPSTSSLAGAAPPQPDSLQPQAPNPNPYAPPGESGPGAHVPVVAEGPPPVDPYADPSAAPDRTPPSNSAPPAGNAPPSEYPAAPAYQPPAGADPSPQGGAVPSAEVATGDFAAALDGAKRELEGGQMASALRQLSKWCDQPQLSPQDQQQLNQLLDQVAGTVVYSTQHLLEPPYEVQPGERLEDIGEKYGVPWQLLAKINGVDNASTLRQGERLKVVRGPFQAVVSLQKRELMLLTADGSYAGRFKIGIGAEHPPQEGTFPVAEKVANPVYYGRDRAISAEDAENPLGERWIGLGNKVGIHGTNNPQNIGRADLPGSISLSEADVEDIYDILSLGSRVTIRR